MGISQRDYHRSLNRGFATANHQNDSQGVSGKEIVGQGQLGKDAQTCRNTYVRAEERIE